MNDLISRQAAIEALTGWETEPLDEDIERALNYLPSAQPEIIRCRDCKHFAGEGMYCAHDIMVRFDHFYCYHAERKETR